MQECDEACKEKEERNVQEQRDEFYDCVHVEMLESIVEVREYARPNYGGGAHIGFLNEVSGPLLDQSCDEST
jgi:hypothetical protein